MKYTSQVQKMQFNQHLVNRYSDDGIVNKVLAIVANEIKNSDTAYGIENINDLWCGTCMNIHNLVRIESAIKELNKLKQNIKSRGGL